MKYEVYSPHYQYWLNQDVQAVKDSLVVEKRLLRIIEREKENFEKHIIRVLIYYLFDTCP